MRTQTTYVSQMIKAAPPFNPVQRDTIVAGFSGLAHKSADK